MRILAINCGSSSIKCAVLAGDPPARSFELRIENIGTAAMPDVPAALDALLAQLRERWSELGELDAVVHRIVHGGERFTGTTLIDDDALATLGTLDRLAPLHNPPALEAVRRVRQLFARVPHIAVFDTAFHTTLPARAREYALPEDIRYRFGIRRFGFHGISHAHVASQVTIAMDRKPQELRIVSCHLGNGASLAAIEYGRSVETSMGMTPLEGLVMGTRAGDLDPGVMLDVFNASTARNNSTERKFRPFVFSRSFASGFSLDLMVKDLATAIDLAAATGTPARLGAACRDLWTSAQADLDAGADHTEVVRWLERAAGTTLGEEA